MGALLRIAGIVSGWSRRLFASLRDAVARLRAASPLPKVPEIAHPGRVPGSYHEGRHVTDHFEQDTAKDIRRALQDEFRGRVARRVRIRVARRLVARKRSREY